MNRPCVDELLKPLKPFQRRTVEHAFHRLFIAEDGTARFLVADEVGLGKTLPGAPYAIAIHQASTALSAMSRCSHTRRKSMHSSG